MHVIFFFRDVCAKIIAQPNKACVAVPRAISTVSAALMCAPRYCAMLTPVTDTGEMDAANLHLARRESLCRLPSIILLGTGAFKEILTKNSLVTRRDRSIGK